jgi:uncharacterized protein (TIGR02246 family)
VLHFSVVVNRQSINAQGSIAMNTLAAVVALWALSVPAFAQDNHDNKATVADTAAKVKQLEHDWIDAEKAGDAEKISAILAEDWQAVNSEGTITTKEQLLTDIRSGAQKLDSYEMGVMDVKVFGGGIAVVQGSDTEKSSYKGKDTSGKYVWTDVFVDRNGKWVAVRSQNALAK